MSLTQSRSAQSTPPETRPGRREWHLRSWREKEALQQPTYPDESALKESCDYVSSLPPLVTSWEVENLKKELAHAARGERFVLQGGDCAESFSDCRADIITSRLKILMQMSIVLACGLKTRVVQVGRFAGQYARPISSETETRKGTTLPSYRGDMINSPEFSAQARDPDPQRLVEAYSSSSLTLNLVRALAEGGFADLHHPEYWNLDFMESPSLAEEYDAIVDAIKDALGFLEAVTDEKLDSLERATFYTSHEALLLPYEEAVSRSVPHKTGIYNLGTHFPWIGTRTNQVENAHVEYARGVENPVGLKVGPDMTPSRLKRLIRTLDPEDEPGGLALITRFGADRIEDRLPSLIGAVRETRQTVLWMCDPMHGNTETTESGTKTRRFTNILSELEQAFAIHAAEGSHLGGVHFELTGENVTECIGGARGLSEADLGDNYKSHTDPRLNYEQSLEMAFLIVQKYRGLS